ncbi:PorV/PorQ family protein [uncultured Hymenobacter sp.]|uniref:putative type IX sorting system protein PorV2 n=1 Tax=uncultured Hymenobacter sp. TaxID=170016 RepID=UPI0035CB26CF
MPLLSPLFRSALGLALAAATLPALAQSTKTPKYSNEFLNVGVGARALGMGKVQVSLADNSTAGYWNPAGLTRQTAKYDGTLMHSELFAGIVKTDYAAFSMPIDERSAVGISVIRLGVDDIADTRSLINEYGQIDYDRISLFSIADYAALLSYARKLGPEGLSVGASAKLIYRNVGSFANAYGFGIDAGLQYQRRGWRLALMARDVTTTFNSWSIDADKFKNTTPFGISEDVPGNSTEITLPRFVLGVGQQFSLPGQFTALVATDIEMTTDGRRNTPLSTGLLSVDPRLGLELGYKQLVFLRGGAGNFQKVSSFDNKKSTVGQYSLGAGVALNGLRVDLALSRLDATFGSYSQTNSLIVSLGYGLK